MATEQNHSFAEQIDITTDHIDGGVPTPPLTPREILDAKLATVQVQELIGEAFQLFDDAYAGLEDGITVNTLDGVKFSPGFPSIITDDGLLLEFKTQERGGDGRFLTTFSGMGLDIDRMKVLVFKTAADILREIEDPAGIFAAYSNEARRKYLREFDANKKVIRDGGSVRLIARRSDSEMDERQFIRAYSAYYQGIKAERDVTPEDEKSFFAEAREKGIYVLDIRFGVKPNKDNSGIIRSTRVVGMPVRSSWSVREGLGLESWPVPSDDEDVVE